MNAELTVQAIPLDSDYYASRPRSVYLTSSESNRVDLTVGPAWRATIKVVDAMGRPMYNVAAELIEDRDGRVTPTTETWQFMQDDRPASKAGGIACCFGRGFTDKHGVLVLRAPAMESVASIRLRASSTRTVIVRHVAVRGSHHYQHIRWPIGSSLSVLAGGSLEPEAGIGIVLERAGGNERFPADWRQSSATRFAKSGRLELRDIPAGSWIVRTTIRGEVMRDGPHAAVQLYGGDAETVELDLARVRLSRVRGRIVDGDGRSLDGAYIQCYRQEDRSLFYTPRWWGRLQPEGTFETPPVPCGNYKFVVSGEPDWRWRVSRCWLKVQEAEADLGDVAVFAHVVRLRVLRKGSNSPVSGARVLLRAYEGSWSKETVTDRSGRIHLDDDVPADEFTVEIQHEGETTKARCLPQRQTAEERVIWLE